MRSTGTDVANALTARGAGVRLKRALEAGQFVLHYQPKVDLRDGRVVGVEALVRWDDPQLGLRYPDHFIPLAERTGLIAELGSWVIDAAARQATIWQRERGQHVRTWVNLAAHQLAEGQHLVDEVTEVLRRHQADPALLGVELTESTLLGSFDDASTALRKLRDLGVEVALDDFGTGYSSLAYLRRLPVNVLKVDRSFVSGMGSSLGDAAIVEAVVDLAHTLGLVVVAEGVEEPGQVSELQALGADRAQGYLFSRPQPAELVGELLSRPWCGRPMAEAPSTVDSRADRLPGNGGPRARLLLTALDALTTSVVVARHSDLPGQQRIVYVNAAFEAETGFRANDVVGQSARQLLADVPANAVPAAELARALAEHRPTTVEVQARRSDGTSYPTEMTVNPVSEAGGTVSHWIVLVRELSAQRGLEADRAAFQAGLEAELARREVTSLFAARCLARNPEQSWDRGEMAELSASVGRVLGVEGCFVDVIDREGGVLRAHGGWRASVGLLTSDLLIPLQQLPRWIEVLDRGDLVEMTGHEAERPDWCKERAAVFGSVHRSQMSAPLRVNGHTYGVIGVLNETAARQWTESERAFLRTIADTAANLLDRHQMFVSSRRTGELSRFLVAVSSLAMDRHGPPVAEALTGQLTELARLHGAEVAFVDVVDERTGTFQRIGHHGPAEHATPRPLAGPADVGRGRRSPDGAGHQHSAGDEHSADERRAGEASVGPSHDRHRAPTTLSGEWAQHGPLAELTPLVVDDIAVTAWDPAATTAAGAGRWGATLCVPFAGDGRLAGVVGVGVDGGRRCWGAQDVEHLQLFGSIIGAAVERERVERALRSSEARFRALAETAVDVVTLTDGHDVLRYVSPSVQEVLGYEAAQLIGTSLTDLLHPEDRPAATAADADMRDHGTMQVEVRLRHASGRWLWCAQSARAVKDHQGRVTECRSSIRDVSDRRQLEEELAARATRDPLTGLANRAELQRHLDAAASRTDIAVLLVDLDGFKGVNDTLGHHVGDRVIQLMAARLSATVRAGDVLARYGGDEFVVFCPAIDAPRASAVAERIVAAVAQRLVVEGHMIHLGASVGVAMPADQSVGSGELVRVADVAMYEAKRAGKGRARLAIAGAGADAARTIGAGPAGSTGSAAADASAA